MFSAAAKRESTPLVKLVQSVSTMADGRNSGVKAWLSNQVSILLGFQSDEAVDYLLTFTSADELRSYISEFFGNGEAAEELASGLIQRMTFEVRSRI